MILLKKKKMYLCNRSIIKLWSLFYFSIFNYNYNLIKYNYVIVTQFNYTFIPILSVVNLNIKYTNVHLF